MLEEVEEELEVEFVRGKVVLLLELLDYVGGEKTDVVVLPLRDDVKMQSLELVLKN